MTGSCTPLCALFSVKKLFFPDNCMYSANFLIHTRIPKLPGNWLNLSDPCTPNLERKTRNDNFFLFNGVIWPHNQQKSERNFKGSDNRKQQLFGEVLGTQHEYRSLGRCIPSAKSMRAMFLKGSAYGKPCSLCEVFARREYHLLSEKGSQPFQTKRKFAFEPFFP